MNVAQTRKSTLVRLGRIPTWFSVLALAVLSIIASDLFELADFSGGLKRSKIEGVIIIAVRGLAIAGLLQAVWKLIVNTPATLFLRRMALGRAATCLHHVFLALSDWTSGHGDFCVSRDISRRPRRCVHRPRDCSVDLETVELGGLERFCVLHCYRRILLRRRDHAPGRHLRADTPSLLKMRPFLPVGQIKEQSDAAATCKTDETIIAGTALRLVRSTFDRPAPAVRGAVVHSCNSPNDGPLLRMITRQRRESPPFNSPAGRQTILALAIA